MTFDHTREPLRLAALLRPLQAALTPEDAIWHLALTPLPALLAAHQLTADDDPDDDIGYVILDFAAEGWPGAITTARQLGLPNKGTFDDGTVVVDGPTLVAILACAHTRLLHVVRVTGEVEPGDVRAMRNAAERGDEPLDVEFRADAFLKIDDGETVCLRTRTAEVARGLVAASLANYIRRTLGDEDVSAPADHQIARILSVSGELSVRPIETEISGTAVDIGISTRLDPDGPATASLIFDRPSATWHDEN